MPPELSPRDKQAMVQSLWTGWNTGGAALEQFPKTIKSILDTEAWCDREVDGKTMHNETFREFIVAPPLKGCGWSKQIDAIEKLLGLKDPDILRRWREAITPPAHRVSGSNNNVITSVQGNSKGYTLDRLSRDYPELYERVVAGELSAHAAAKQAGFRKSPTPYEQVVKLLPKLSATECAELRRRLDANC